MHWIILDLFIWSGDGITEKVQTDLKPCYSHSHSLLIAIHMPSCSLVRQQETFQAQMQMNFPSCMATHFAIAWFIELHKNWLFGCEKLHIQCDEKNMFLNNPVVLPHWSQFPAAAPNGSKDPTHHRVTCHRASAKNMGLPFARRMWVYPNTKKDRKVHHHHLHHHHHQHLIIIDHYQPLLTIINHYEPSSSSSSSSSSAAAAAAAAASNHWGCTLPSCWRREPCIYVLWRKQRVLRVPKPKTGPMWISQQAPGLEMAGS